MIQDEVVLSCGGSAGPTCFALGQDDAQQKNSDGRTVNGTKGVTWRGFGSGKNAFEGFPQWQHHSQLDYNRYYATGLEANCQPKKNIAVVSRAEFTWWHFYSWRHDQVGKPLEFVLLFGS